MTAEAPLVQRGQSEADSSDPGRLEERAGSVALSLLPGGLIVYFSFEGGGYFAGSVAFIALLLTQILLVRVLFARHPFAGWSRRLVIVAALFAAYTGWTLCSALWSHALGRALVEFDRSLLYLLLLVLFGSLPRSTWRMPVILRGLAGGSLAVCTVSLVTRLLPHLWPVSPGVANNRLSYPLTYWNALGILAGLCILFLLGLISNPRERRFVRALAAAGVPIAAATLLLTFSRGGIAALVAGLLVFLAVGWTPAMPGSLLAVVPTAGVGLLFTYRANLLATVTPTSVGAVNQGHKVALAVGICSIAAASARLLLDPLHDAVNRLRPAVPVTATARRWLAAFVVVGALVVAVAVGGPGWVSSQFRTFIKSAPVHTADLRSRLTDPSGDNRTDNWRAALDGFATAPVLGTGAGTYEFSWYRYRHLKGLTVVDAHNLYLQTLSELGIMGVGLLVAVICGVLYALARRIHGPNRVAYAAVLAATVAWMVHAAVDWDWQMPAVTAWMFAVGGAALASGHKLRAGPATLVGRVPIAAVWLGVAVIPILLMLSQAKLETAANAFQTGACGRVEGAASESIGILSVRPEPYQMLGYCDISDGKPRAAVAALTKAVNAERGDWQFHYGLSIAQAYAGKDPRPELRIALRFDPGDPLVEQMRPVLRTHSRRRWRVTARRAYAGTFASGRLTLR